MVQLEDFDGVLCCAGVTREQNEATEHCGKNDWKVIPYVRNNNADGAFFWRSHERRMRGRMGREGQFSLIRKVL